MQSISAKKMKMPARGGPWKFQISNPKFEIESRPFHVFAGARVNFDLLAGLDEQGHL